MGGGKGVVNASPSVAKRGGQGGKAETYDYPSLAELSTLLLAVYVVALVAGAVHWGGVEGEYVYDDKAVLLRNADVGYLQSVVTPSFSLSPLSQLFKSDYWGTPLTGDGAWTHKSYRPLTMLTFRLDYCSAAHGLIKCLTRSWPQEEATSVADTAHWLDYVSWRLHVTNVFIHAVACGLLTAVLYLSVFRRLWQGLGNRESVMLASLAGGLLFAVHPVHVEAVASIIGRADSLACCSVLLALLFVEVASSRKVSSSVSMIASGMVGVFLSASVFFKETGITGFALVPLVLLLSHTPLDVWKSSWKERKIRTDAKKSILQCTFVVALALAVITLRLLATGGSVDVNMSDYYNRLRELGTTMRLVNVPYIFLINMDRMLLPSWLAYDYSEIGVVRHDSSLTDIQALVLPLVPAFLMISLLVIALLYAPRPRLAPSRLLLLIIGWLFAALLPSSQIVFPVGFLLAERVLYTASAAVCALCGAVFAVYFKHRKLRWISIVLFTTALAISAGHTVKRSQDWRSEDALFEAQLNVFSQHEMSLHGLGWNSFQERNFEVAKRYLGHSALDEHAESVWMLGRIAYLEGDTKGAIEHFERAVVIQPNHKANNELGMMLWVSGDKQSAYTHILRSLYAPLPHSAPERRSILNNAGCMLLLVDHNPTKALEYFSKAFNILGDAVYLQNTVHPHAALGNYPAATNALLQLQNAGLAQDQSSVALLRTLREFVENPGRKWEIEPHCTLQFLEY